MKRRRDRRCSDGVLAECDRLIRKGGLVKFAGWWWQSDDLIPHAGKVALVWPDYYLTELTVFPDENGIPIIATRKKFPR